ncbi:hypothetical protein M0R01_04410 [bacterium]|jgi:hypothetical protein|nr:hypothetical protein [bacterium]
MTNKNTYKKVSETEFKETEQISVTQEKVYSLKSLYEKKICIIDQLEREQKELESRITTRKAELEKVEELIAKAEELGIKEVSSVKEEPKEIPV